MAPVQDNANVAVIRAFEERFKNQLDKGVVDELTTAEFVHRLPYPGLPPGRDGLRAIQGVISGEFSDICVEVELMIASGDYVADRVVGHGVRRSNKQPTDWVEHEIYRLKNGKIDEFWAQGGPTVEAR